MRFEKKHPRVSGYSVPDVPKQKSAFQGTQFSKKALIKILHLFAS